MRAASGPVFGSKQFLVCRVEKPAQINTLMAAQLAMIGAWDVGPFLDDIRHEEFALGFLTFDLMKDQYDEARFTPAMIEAFREHYRPSEQIGAYHTLSSCPCEPIFGE